MKTVKKVKLTEEQRELLRIMDVDVHAYDAATNTCELRECIFEALKKLGVDLEEVKEQEFNEPWKPEKEKTFYSIKINGFIEWYNWSDIEEEHKLFNAGNVFKTRKLAEARAKKDAINRKLEAFSLANGGDEIDWEDDDEDAYKYYIYYNYSLRKLEVTGTLAVRDIGQTYFISREVAQEAIRRYGDEFIEAYGIKESKSE